jgi:hypothetical protein
MAVASVHVIGRELKSKQKLKEDGGCIDDVSHRRGGY